MKKILFTTFLFSILICEPYNGLTLITSINKNFNQDDFDYTHLIDNEQNILNSWTHDTSPASIAYLTNDSLLYVPCAIDNLSRQPDGGRFKIMNWEGDIIWDYILPEEKCKAHHDIAVLPNGNILAICTEFKSELEAQNFGKLQVDGTMGIDMVIEIEPLGNDDARIVWEWHFWDHLVQDISSTFTNYGTVSEHPELLNINCISDSNRPEDWNHCNSISYNYELDQILLTSRYMNEIYIIDHSTTSLEAASHSGGTYGKGGDFLYRWGNSTQYDRYDPLIFSLNAPHGADWSLYENQSDNSIIIFNNLHSDNSSSVIEIIPPVDYNYNYVIPESSDIAIGPNQYSWIYQSDFFSQAQSGAFRLPNRNTLITTFNAPNKVFEIDIDGNIQWEYEGNLNCARAIKYPIDYLDSDSVYADINNDGVVNIIDVLVLVNDVLSNSYNSDTDLNADGVINVLDIVQIVNIILN